jgi:hypothetical protein
MLMHATARFVRLSAGLACWRLLLMKLPRTTVFRLLDRGKPQRLPFYGTSTGKSCAYTVVVYIFVLIAEELAYAFTRKSSTTVRFASQGARASSAPAKAAARAVGA